MMKENNEQLSAMIDDEAINNALVDELILDEQQQSVFSRYHLIGDVMRGQDSNFSHMDISASVMAEIDAQNSSQDKSHSESVSSPQTNNVISFRKRFAQYAIAASVTGVVVLTSLMNTGPERESNLNRIEVLNTVPFGGGVAPVSLQAKRKHSPQEIKKYNERLEALLQDHQLQLQTQP